MNDGEWNPKDEKEPWENGEGQPEIPGEPAAPDGTPTEDREPTGESAGSGPSGSEASGDAGVPAEDARPDGGAKQEENGAQWQQPYPNPQNPYPQYGPYGGPYGPSADQGGAYGQWPYSPQQGGGYSYGGRNYGQYGQQYGPQYPYGQYPNTSPYGGYGQQPPRPPRKMGTGLKVFLSLLAVVAVGLLVAGVFTAQLINSHATGNGTGASSPESSLPEKSSESPSSSGKVIGGVQGDGTNPNGFQITIAPKPQGSQLTATEVYKKVIQSVVSVETEVKGATTGESGTSEGTGIIATADGYILTNAHVVNYSRSNKVTVVTHSNQKYEAKVVGYDKTSDLAVLKVNASNLSPAVFGNADTMEVGDQVIAIGNPGGLSFAGSLTGGYISALSRSIEAHSDNGMTYIQTDAAINPGNSGGPLVNMYGQVIGINSNKIIATGYEGMGFAIPVSRAKTIINDLISHGYVSGRTRLGITGSDVPEAYVGLGFPQGVVIQGISADSDMKRAGVKTGDIITKADGKEITGMEDLLAVLNKHKPGDVISMTIYTGAGSISGSGSNRQIKVKLLEDKGETQSGK